MLYQRFLLKHHFTSGRIKVYSAFFVVFLLGLSFLVSGFLTPTQLAQAAAKTWDGGGTDGTCGGAVGDGNKWSCGLNWSGDTVPLAGDTLTFDTTSTKDATVDAGFTINPASLTIAAGYTGTITLANTLHLTATFNQAAGTFNAANQTLDVDTTFTLSAGTFTASSGTIFIAGTFTVSGTPIFNANGGTMSFDNSSSQILTCNNVTFNLVTFPGIGTRTVNSGCNLPFGTNPSIANAVILNGTISGTGTITLPSNSGNSLTMNSGGTLSGFSAFIASGPMTVSGATFDASSYSSFIASQGVTLSSGTLSLPTVGADLNSTLTISGGTFNAPSGTMTLAGALTISGTPIFNANGGTVTFDGGSATLSCNNVTFNLVSFVGQTSSKTVNSDCSLPLGNNPSTFHSVILNGTLSGSGTLTALVGSFTLNSGASLSGFSGLNAATFTNAGATTNLSSYSSFIASSILTLSSGTLSLPSGSDLSLLTISGGTFNAPSGTMTVASSLTVSGSPTFNANGGTITFDGSSATLSCNNVTFSLVVLAHVAGTKTVNSNCNLPLGINPTIPLSLILNGTLSGSGTLTESSGTLTLNSGASLSGFSDLSVSALTNAGATTNLSSYSSFFASGTVTLSSGTLSLPSSGADINSALIISGGTFNAPSGTMTVAGALTISGSPTFNANGGTITFDAVGGTQILTCNSVTFNAVVIGGTGTKTVNSGCTLPLGASPTVASTVNLSGVLSGTGTYTASAALTLNSGASLSGFTGLVTNSTFTISGGTLNAGSYTTLDVNSTFTLSSGTFTAPSGTATFATNFTISGSPTFNANGGTITFDAVGGTQILTCNSVTFNAVVIGGTGTKTVNSGCTLPLGASPTVASTVNLSGVLSGTGTYTASAALTLNSGASLSGFSGLSAATLTNAGATTNLSSYSSFAVSGTTTISSGSLTVPVGSSFAALTNSGGIFSAAGAITASSTVTLSSGTLTLPSSADLNGALIISNGTFNAPSGTMTLAGALTISGTPIFNANGGTVTFDGSTATLSCNNVTFNLVVFNNTGTKTVNSNCSLPLGANPTIPTGVSLVGTLSGSGTLAMTDGFFTLNSGATLSGFSGLNLDGLSMNGALTDLSGFSSFVVADTAYLFAGTLTVPSGASFTGPLTILAGILEAPNGTLTIADDFTIGVGQEGNFHANSGTVNISGVTARLTCSGAVFNSVTFSNSGRKYIDSTCYFPIGNNPTLSGSGDIVLSGTLTGTGSMTKSNGTLTTQSNANLFGFSSYNLSNLVVNDDVLADWAGDEGSGSSTADSSLFGNTGTLNGASFSTDVPSVDFSNSHSLSFDGTDDYVTAGNDPSVRPQFPFSASLWANFDSFPSTSSDAGLISSSAPSGTGYCSGFSISAKPGGGLEAFVGNNAGCNGSGSLFRQTGTTVGISAGEWHHIVVNFNTIDDAQIYVDGIVQTTFEAGSATRMVYDETNTLRLGQVYKPLWGVGYLDGKMDDVRLYNRSLTGGEISALAGGSDSIGTQPTYTLGAPLTVSGDLTIHDSILDVSTDNHAINLAGNWINQASGSFTPRSGTVTLTGGNQSITGSNTFYNLTKSVSAATTLTFEAGKVQTITNALTLNGNSGNLLSLRSSTPGTQWQIDPQLTRILDYLDVQDSQNTNSTAITVLPATNTNSGNNTGWIFSAAATPTSTPTPTTTTGETSSDDTETTTIPLPDIEVNATSEVIEETSIQVGSEVSKELEKNQVLERYLVRIKIVDANHNPIPGATVTLYSTPVEGTTDTNGQVIFTGVKPGIHTVVINYFDQTGSQVITVKDDDAFAVIGYDFTLTLVPTDIFAAARAEIAVFFILLILVIVSFMFWRAYRHYAGK